MQKRLDAQRNVLDTQILINLRYVHFESPSSSASHLKLKYPDEYPNRQRLDLVSLQRSKGFQDLDEKVQNLIKIVSQGPKNSEELRDLMLHENKKIKESISSGFQEDERHRLETEQHARLLKSLWFAEILMREETIAEAHAKTFQWIFDKSGRAVRPWSNFNVWLENGEGIYWISGKAGSGKSTLMNFLFQDERTMEALDIWSGTKDVLMPKFFFWSGGTMMQRNFEGLLRSLLWQIVGEFPVVDILPISGEPRSEQKKRRKPYSQASIGVWTKRRLHRALQEAINQLRSSCRLCFFIDGLDEFDDDKDDLIAFVREIVSSTRVKICLSSRPDREFEDAFGSSACLRLQDLTRDDIRRYVTDKFQKVPQMVSMTLKNRFEMNKVKEQIVDRAEGVFLWVSLAVKDQVRGLKNDDSPKQLQDRLARLPTQIEGIYLRMLDRIDKIYLQEASSFLKMALYKPEWSLFQHALASYPGLEELLSPADTIPEREIVSFCQFTRKKLSTRCAGLLEVHQLNNCGLASVSEANITDAKVLGMMLSTPVVFVHRTAVDFLENLGPGKAFLDTNLSSEFDPQIQVVKALLGELRLMKGRDKFTSPDDIDKIMEAVLGLENSIGKPQVRLCKLMDRIMSYLDRSDPDWSSDSHWCTRWGKLAVIWEVETATSTTSSSRSSPRDTSFPTTSPSTSSSTEPGDFSPTQIGSRNFNSFAASHGLSLYVNHVLDQEKHIGPEALDDMLYCSTLARRMKPAELLRRGATPNAIFNGKTIWEHLLSRMASMWIWKKYDGCRLDVSDTKNLLTATIAFVDMGQTLVRPSLITSPSTRHNARPLFTISRLIYRAPHCLSLKFL